MELDAGILTVIFAIVVSVVYGIVLIKLDIIRMPKKRKITTTIEFVQYNLLREANNYAKMVQGVLHSDLFNREDFANLVAALDIPIFIIFGPHLCWKTSRFLNVFKKKSNIRLYQFLGTEIEGLAPHERAEITTIRNQHFLVVDGIHCFLEMPHAENEIPEAGWEMEKDITEAAKYEDKFDRLAKYCREIDGEHIIKSIGLDNIYTLVDGESKQVISLNGDFAGKLLAEFAESIDEIDELEDVLTAHVRKGQQKVSSN